MIFRPGLAAEVDAWLRGEPTRRDFIKRFGQATGMLALSGGALPSFVNSALAQAQMQLEDPNTPLGKAQALALAASTEGPADGSAFRAVEAAKQYSGVNLNMTYEAGSAGARPAQLLRPALGAAHRHQVDRGRASRRRTCTRSRSPSTSPPPAPTTSSTCSRSGRRRSPTAG